MIHNKVEYELFHQNYPLLRKIYHRLEVSGTRRNTVKAEMIPIFLGNENVTISGSLPPSLVTKICIFQQPLSLPPPVTSFLNGSQESVHDFYLVYERSISMDEHVLRNTQSKVCLSVRYCSVLERTYIIKLAGPAR